MAILNDGPNGGFTGKVGSIYGYKSMGQWIIRGAPKLSRKNKKGSVKQNFGRSKFKTLQHLLGKMMGYIRPGFTLLGKERNYSAHNAAKSYNMHHAFTEEGVLDYSKLLLSYGNLELPENIEVAVTETGFSFTWTTECRGFVHGHAVDQVMVMAYCPEKEYPFYDPAGARRLAGTEVIELPLSYKGRSFHIWISFISQSRDNVSMSKYLGELVY